MIKQLKRKFNNKRRTYIEEKIEKLILIINKNYVDNVENAKTFFEKIKKIQKSYCIFFFVVLQFN